jgi:hypothetical protein
MVDSRVNGKGVTEDFSSINSPVFRSAAILCRQHARPNNEGAVLLDVRETCIPQHPVRPPFSMRQTHETRGSPVLKMEKTNTSTMENGVDIAEVCYNSYASQFHLNPMSNKEELLIDDPHFSIMRRVFC